MEREQCLSRAKINDLFNYCREAVVIYIIDKQTSSGEIYGPDSSASASQNGFRRTLLHCANCVWKTQTIIQARTLLKKIGRNSVILIEQEKIF